MRIIVTCVAVVLIAHLVSCGIKRTRIAQTYVAPERQVAVSADKVPERQWIQIPAGMQPGIDYREDEIIVGFRLDGFANPASLAGGNEFNKNAMLNPVLYQNQAIAEFAREIAVKHNLALIPNGEGYVKAVNFCAYKLTPQQDANKVAALLRLKYPAKVMYVEYNGIVQPAYYPNDPYYLDNSLWGLDKIRTDLAWDVVKGDPDQWITVIDTGIYTDTTGTEYHDDLYNWGYIPGINTDLVDGDEIPEDIDGHGTHVAGTIAAIGDNGKGVVGIAYESKILPIKALGPSGGSDAVIASAILLSVEAGCSVINMSLGNSLPNRTSAEACAQAYSDGVAIIAAAGNDNRQAPCYPGSYPEVINVGACDVNDNRASYSSFGYTLDIVAPGGDGGEGDASRQILSTWINDSYGWYHSINGTSMASPHVAGVAALVRALRPEFTPNEVRAVIEWGGDDVLNQNEWQAAVHLYRLNAYTPLTFTVSGLPTIDITNYNDYDAVFGDFTIEIDAWASTEIAGVHYYVDGQYFGWSDVSPFDYSLNTSYLVPGLHTFTVEVIDTENSHGFDSVILESVDTGLATPYWTGFETLTEQAGWWGIDYSNSESIWQFDTVSGNTHVYFGDTDKPGGRGYYSDDVDWLVSPSLNLFNLTEPALYFTAKWDFDVEDCMLVGFVTSDGNDNFIDNAVLQNDDWPDWSLIGPIDLSEFSGLKGRLEFWAIIDSYSSEGAGFWLDNVVITDSAGPPVVTIASPTPAASSLVQGQVTLNATAVDDNEIILGSTYKIGGSTVRTFAGSPSQFVWNSATALDGDRTFTVTADDELSKYGYVSQGAASRSFYVHNSTPGNITLSPALGRAGDQVTVSGNNFGRDFAGETFVFFSGTTGNIAAVIDDWNSTSIDCIVPDGTITGPVRVQIGSLTGVSENDFEIMPVISGFAFTSPAPGFFIENPTEFVLTPQPDAERIEFEIIGQPLIAIPDDNTPSSIKLSLAPSDFPANGAYILKATAIAPGEEVSVTINFFVEKLRGDFNGDGVVNSLDLDFLKLRLWLTPASPAWIPYLDANRDGIIDELDAAIVGYSYGMQS